MKLIFVFLISLTSSLFAQDRVYETKRSVIIVPEKVTYPTRLQSNAVHRMACEQQEMILLPLIKKWERDCTDPTNSGCAGLRERIQSTSMQGADFSPYNSPFWMIDPQNPPTPGKTELEMVFSQHRHEIGKKQPVLWYLGESFFLPEKQVLQIQSLRDTHVKVRDLLGNAPFEVVAVEGNRLVPTSSMAACALLETSASIRVQTRLLLDHQDIAPKAVIEEARAVQQALGKSLGKGNLVAQLLTLAPRIERLKETATADFKKYLKLETYEVFSKFFYVDGERLDESKVRTRDFQQRSDLSLSTELFQLLPEDRFTTDYEIQVIFQAVGK